MTILMADLNPSSPTSPKRGRWKMWVGLIVGIPLFILVGLVGVACYLTTDSGFRTFILPQVSKRFGIEITAQRVQWEPLSSIKVEGLRIGPENEPLLQVKQLIAHYDGQAILRGTYDIQSLLLNSPSLHLSSKTDESVQILNQILHPRGTTSDSKPSIPALPQPVWSISSLNIEDMEIVHDSSGLETKVQHLRLSAKNIKPQATIPIELQADFNLTRPANPGASTNSLSELMGGRMKSVLNVEWDDHFRPKMIHAEIEFQEGHGNLLGRSLGGFTGPLKLDISISSDGIAVLKEAKASIQKNGEPFAAMGAIGTLNFPEKKVELDLQCLIQSRVLNQIFAAQKVDFQNSSISYALHLSLLEGGSRMTAQGEFESRSLTFTHPDMPRDIWKPVALNGEYLVDVNWPEQRVEITKLSIDARQQDKPFLKGTISKPISLVWSDLKSTNKNFETTDFILEVFPLDITPFGPLLKLPEGWKLHSGLFAANARILVEDQGRKLTLNGHAGLTHIALRSPGLKLTNTSLLSEGRIHLQNFRTAEFQSSALKITENGKPLLTATTSGKAEVSTHRASGTLEFDSSIPDLLALKLIPAITVSTGTLAGVFHWELHPGHRFTSKSDVTVRNLDFRSGKIRYPQASLAINANVDWNFPVLRLDNIRMATFLAEQPAGSWQGNLSWNSTTSALLLNYKLQDWNEPILSPVFAAWLPDKKLSSLELAGQGELALKNGSLDLKTTIDAKKFLMETGSSVSLKPLNASISMDLGWSNNGSILWRSLTLQMDPAPAAKNLFQISGITRSITNSFFADLKLQGHSLDLTGYHDQIFSFSKSAVPTTSTTTSSVSMTPSSAIAGNSKSQTPRVIRDIALLVIIDSLKIHDFVLTDLTIPFRQNGNSIQLSDASMKIGGALVTASITTEQGKDKPPFRFEAKTDRLALGPVVDVLKPELKGLVGGTLTAKTYGTGRGTSRTDLEQSLDGVIEIAIHQAHLEKVPSFQKSLRQLGEKLESSEITNSTVDDVDASAKIASGTLHTDNLHLKGSAVEASLRGNVFANQTLHMDASLKIKREVMSHSNLLAQFLKTGGSEKGDWVKLPGKMDVTGTLSEPQLQFDVGKLLGDSLINTGVKILKDILQPRKEGESTSDPNQPPSDKPKPKSPLDKILDGIFK